ncbi:C3a anaphylatoxin chemotactic receptor-like [Pseudorasbora parva]|uniref:C3a anaphylatoxin chemotactic receptor-like n=1 Tax=Pseudorasbora parva TaxID=51549 RepID=UPI00351E8FD0
MYSPLLVAEATSFGPENLTKGPTNDTTTQPMSLGFGIFFICIFIVTFIVGLIGNGLVIFLTCCRMKTTVKSIWFLNLATADFIYILAIILIILFMIYFSLDRSLIYFISIAMTLNMFASNFLLVVISLDRCLCTWMPVWAQNNRTVFRARIICMIVWVLSIGCSIPFYTVHSSFAKFLVTYEFLVGCLIPFLIIASCHIAIGVRIKRLKMGKQLRSYRVIITVILAFFICCFPYYFCLFCAVKIVNLSASDEVFRKAMIFSAYLFFLNSSLNPFLYVLMCDEYKKKLKQSLLLVLEKAFAEDHLDFRERQIQKDEQNQTNTFELLLL